MRRTTNFIILLSCFWMWTSCNTNTSKSIKQNTLPTIVIDTSTIAPSPTRFAQEIAAFQSIDQRAKYASDLIVFTGSSSIRMWTSLSDDFPEHAVLNRGFGGSTMGDLYYYRQELILKYQPKQVFIYEGDNDVAAKQEVAHIMQYTKALVQDIKTNLPNTTIVFISPKPSIARWHLKDQYLAINKALETYATTNGMQYIDVWTPMLNEDGTYVNESIFIEDGLHLNETGYKIWTTIISPYLK